MKRSSRLFRNTFFLALAQISNPFLSMIFILVLAHGRGTDGLGGYTTVLTLFSLFTLCSTLGLNELIIREVAADRSKAGKAFSNLFWIGLGSSAFFIVLMILTSALLHYDRALFQSACVLAIALPFFTLSIYSQALLQSFEKMEFCSFILIAETIWKVFVGTVALGLGLGLQWIMGILVFAYIQSCILGLVFVRKYVTPLHFRIDWPTVRGFIRQVPTFLTLSVVVLIYWSTDIMMLSKMRSIAEVGLYSAGYRLLTIAKGLVHSYIMAVFPVMSSQFETSPESFRKSCVRSIKFLMVMTIPVAVIVSFLSKEILFLLYGSKFVEAAGALRILICPIILFPIANLFGNALIASHHQKADLLINGISALVNVLLNVFLIRRYGYSGAALATLISIVFFVLLQSFAIRKTLFSIHYGELLAKPVVAAAVMVGAMFGLKMLTPVVSSVIGLALFIVTLIATRYFSDDEMKILHDLWKDKKLLFALNRSQSHD
jgi:O-antigen/teichoic acid export membrane protein